VSQRGKERYCSLSVSEGEGRKRISSPRRDVLLVQPDEQDKGPERHAPAQDNACNPERPTERGHGEREGEDTGANHRGEVVLVLILFFFRGFLRKRVGSGQGERGAALLSTHK